MSKSFASGDYRLVLTLESASTEGNWYRVLQDKQTLELSCDCPRWLHKRGTSERSCKHTDIAQQLLLPPTPATPLQRLETQVRTFINRLLTVHAPPPAVVETPVAVPTSPASLAFEGQPLTPTTPHEQSLVTAAQDQWQGLSGIWRLAERDTRVGTTPYRFVLLRLDTPNGLMGTGVVAFTHKYGLQTARMIPGVAGWAGYNVAAQIAHQAGFAMVGQPPEHFKWKASRRTTTPRIALHNILRVAERTDLGDGLTPLQRAENTLQLFLGDALYKSLQSNGYLDVPSTLHADRQRVYRLRRDKNASYPRRIRVFERGQVPEADHLLTVFLQLMSDEATVLKVIRTHNIFAPYSDSRHPETITPVWRDRAA
jgi:hypothetical protein